MSNAILALNAGSSSIKFTLFDIAEADQFRLTATGEIEGIGVAPHFIVRDSNGNTLKEERWPNTAATNHEALLAPMLLWIDSRVGQNQLIGVGHRVVHGGRDLTEPVPIDANVVQTLDRLTPLAPLHQPHSLAPIRAIMKLRPHLPQVACFDTAFHHTLSPVAARFALPREYEAEGVRRYGFHGLSYEYIAYKLREVAPKLAAGRCVVAHLGNGASLCAMQDGRSIDTTMGFTALEGLMMGTRCGAIDAGVVLYMLQQKGMSPHEVEQTLYKRSGLLGVSGISSDMRELLASSDPRAAEAIELFVFRIARETAALVGMLGGLDGFVFTAGIGERAVAVRAAVCERLRWLGVVLDPAANARHAPCISTPESRVEVRVVPTNEELMIARHTLKIGIAR